MPLFTKHSCAVALATLAFLTTAGVPAAAQDAPATQAAPVEVAASPENHSPFTPTSIVAGILGGLGAMWLIRRRAAQAQNKNKPNA